MAAISRFPLASSSQNPVNYIDPDGRYAKWVHFAMTLSAANHAGYDYDSARRIAAGAESVDYGWTKPTLPWNFWARYHHHAFWGPLPQSRLINKRSHLISRIRKAPGLTKKGQISHTLEDSFPHEGYSWGIGHWRDMKTPDLLQTDAKDAALAWASVIEGLLNFSSEETHVDEAALATFEFFADLGGVYLGNNCQQLTSCNDVKLIVDSGSAQGVAAKLAAIGYTVTIDGAPYTP